MTRNHGPGKNRNKRPRGGEQGVQQRQRPKVASGTIRKIHRHFETESQQRQLVELQTSETSHSADHRRPTSTTEGPHFGKSSFPTTTNTNATSSSSSSVVVITRNLERSFALVSTRRRRGGASAQRVYCCSARRGIVRFASAKFVRGVSLLVFE